MWEEAHFSLSLSISVSLFPLFTRKVNFVSLSLSKLGVPIASSSSFSLPPYPFILPICHVERESERTKPNVVVCRRIYRKLCTRLWSCVTVVLCHCHYQRRSIPKIASIAKGMKKYSNSVSLTHFFSLSLSYIPAWRWNCLFQK